MVENSSESILASILLTCLWQNWYSSRRRELIEAPTMRLPPNAVQICWLHERPCSDFELRSAVNFAVNPFLVVVVLKRRELAVEIS